MGTVSGVGVGVPSVDSSGGQVNSNGVAGQVSDLIEAEIGMNAEGSQVAELSQMSQSSGGADLRKEEEEEVDPDYHISSVKERKSWMERFEELKLFKEKHGNCNVPWKWKENLPLFYWVRRMKDKKRAGALSEERIAMMEEIGFEWVKGQNKERERRKQHQVLMEQKRKQLKQDREQQLQQGGTLPVQVPVAGMVGVGVVGDALQLHQHAQLQAQMPFDLQGAGLTADLQSVYPASFTMTSAGVVETGGAATSAAMLSQFGFAKLYPGALASLPADLGHGQVMAGLPTMQFLGSLPTQVMGEVGVVNVGEEHKHHEEDPSSSSHHHVHDPHHQHHDHHPHHEEENEEDVGKLGEEHKHHEHHEHTEMEKKDNEGVVDELVEAHSHI